MSSHDLTVQRFTNLRGSNDYPAWKQAIKYSLVSGGLWEMIGGEEEEPSAAIPMLMPEGSGAKMTMAENLLRIEWKAKNNKTIGLIMCNVTMDVSAHIEHFKTAKEMWGKLQQLYDAKGFVLRLTLQSNLYNCRLDQYSSVDEYASKFKGLLVANAEQDFVLKNESKVILFLNNLGSAYPLWVTAVRSSVRRSVSDLDELISELIDEARVEGRNESLALVGKL